MLTYGIQRISVLLCTTIATTSVVLCGNVEAKHLSIAEAINVFNQKSWRIIGHNKIVDADKDSWIKDTLYEDSITKVIGEALGKCLSDTDEFVNKNSSDTVIFSVTPEQTEYTPENWNAVVLWNYLNQLRWNFTRNKKLNSDEIFDKVYAAVFRYYNDEYADKIIDLDGEIKRAISDIKEYAKALDLEGWMQSSVETVQKLKGKDVKSIYHEVRNSSLPENPPVYISPIIRLWGTDYSENNPFCITHIRGIVDKTNPLKIVVDNLTYMVSQPVFDWGKDNKGTDKSELKRKVEEIRDPNYGSPLLVYLQNDIYDQALKILED